MLVSSGVAVAYFASIALLALAASQAPSPTGEGDSTTYFDSVVLLTMFLLSGESLFRDSLGQKKRLTNEPLCNVQADSWKRIPKVIPQTLSLR